MDEPALISSLDFGPFVRQGIGKGPRVLIGDQSEISLMTSAHLAFLDHRMALLARPGDIVVVRQRDTDFENYLADHLGFSNVTFLESASGSEPVTRWARKSIDHTQMLANIAAKNGGLTLMPYLTTGNTWRLAQAIGEKAQQVVHVAGPSPRVARRSNDKLWFTTLAQRILGREATPPTLFSYGPAATAGLIARLSKSSDQLVIKVPDSAGSAGNVRLDSEILGALSTTGLRRLVLDRLHATGWQDRYPILVGVWDSNVRCSPSVQLWIPPIAEGPPIAKAIFEQHVHGLEAAFVGAVRSTLSDALQNKLIDEATSIATVLQQIGYFGACSLDAVICPGDDGNDIIHWIECNGRWSGVSIPLTAAEDLIEPQYKKGLLIVQEIFDGRCVATKTVTNLLSDLMFKQGYTTDGLILMSPLRNHRGVSFNALVVGPTTKIVREVMAQARNRIKTKMQAVPA